MKPDEICVCFLNPADAARIIKKDPEFIDAAVVTNLVPEGESIVVSRDVFLEWLLENEEETEIKEVQEEMEGEEL